MEGFVLTVTILVVVKAAPLDEFYPFDLSVNQQLIANDDASSRAIALNPPLIFYGRSYGSCKIHNNGLVTLNTPPEHFLEDPLPLHNYTFIAPFYGDVDTRKAGTVWFTDPVANDSSILTRAADEIHEVFEEHALFNPSYLIIATWDKVGYFKERSDKLNTFQCIITTDGYISFAIFVYNETQWTSSDDSNLTQAKIGFNEGTLIESWEVPCSMTRKLTEIPTTSNVGIPGKWIFRIDEGRLSVCPNDNAMACESDQFCSCLTTDPNQKCQCSNLTRYIPDCSSAPTIPETGSDVNSSHLTSNKMMSSAATLILLPLIVLDRVL